MDDSDDEFDQIVTPDNELDKVLCVCVCIICLTYRVGHKDSQYRAPCYIQHSALTVTHTRLGYICPEHESAALLYIQYHSLHGISMLLRTR